MGGQNLERRDILKALATAAVASQFPGFRSWSFAWAQDTGTHHSSSSAASSGPYQPTFFRPDEYTLLERLADIIIPSDGSPGARDAGVSEFIDFMVSQDPEIQFPFRYGLSWLNARSRALHGDVFVRLTDGDQTKMLERFAYTNQHRADEIKGQEFFNLVREYTVLGFYTSKIGLEELDYPGLQLAYSDPGCPHTDDRSHERLPPPGV